MPHFWSGILEKGRKKLRASGSGSSGSSHDGTDYSKSSAPPVPAKDADDLVSKLNDLSLNTNVGKGNHAKPEFVRGFKHGPARPDVGRTSASAAPLTFPTPAIQSTKVTSQSPPGPLPRPPQMLFPTPVHYKPSRTMQYALAPPSDTPVVNASGPHNAATPPKLAVRPHSAEPPHTSSSLSASPARLKVPRPVSSPPMTPASSKASSSGGGTPGNGGDDRIQCHGITKKGERCTRQVKADPPLSIVDPDMPVERFCYQHKKEVNAQTGFYSRRTKDWIDFSHYIPEYLHPDTQAALRIEMEEPPSQSDEAGFIYCIETRDPDTPFMIRLKVGRTVDLVKRLNEWQRECESKEQIVRGWWPGNIMDKNFETSLLKGRVQSGPRGAHCHKLERLVHIELADLVVHAPYLNENFPNVKSEAKDDSSSSGKSASNSKPGTPAKNGKRSGGTSSTPLALNSLQQGNDPCPDCGKFHKEIFPFTRPGGGPYRDEEWEKLVMPVIEKWGWFVEILA